MARAEPDRRFGDVFNLVCDRATLLVAWERVAGNRGARTAGVDAVTRYHVENRLGVTPFLEELRSSLRDGSFTALPVKQAVIPKKGGKVRYLGIPTLRDRVAQMALKLVLEPIFEAGFYPSSYGYRPGGGLRMPSPRSTTSPASRRPTSGSSRAISRLASTTSTIMS
jgi:RNA-directed DNA polymerase